MAEQRVYRGWSREEALAVYHADAEAAAKRGYVPIDERWVPAFGMAVLTVTYEHRPSEVAEVRRLLESRAASPTADSVGRGSTRRAWLGLALVAAVLIVVGVVAMLALLDWFF